MSTPETNPNQPSQAQTPTETEKDPIATPGEILALKELISKKTEEYDTKGKRNKVLAISFQVTVTLLSVLTTIFLGLKTKAGIPDISILNAAVLCSAIVAGLNVIIAFFDYKELWVQYKVSRSQLRVLTADLEFLEVSDKDMIRRSKVREIFEKYKSICNETDQYYRQLRTASDTTESK